jgi:WD40 repeat protein
MGTGPSSEQVADDPYSAVQVLEGHEGGITFITSLSSTTFTTGGNDGIVCFWLAATGTLVQSHKLVVGSRVTSILAFKASSASEVGESSYAAIGCSDGTLGIFSEDGTLLRQIKFHKSIRVLVGGFLVVGFFDLGRFFNWQLCGRISLPSPYRPPVSQCWCSHFKVEV